MTERTLIIIKPDAFQAGKTDAILEAFRNQGFRIVASRELCLSSSEAQDFYAEHRGKPFFDDLVAFMTSAPCLTAVLEADNAVQLARTVVGATNPSLAAKGTLRHSFGSSTTKNAVHASDSPSSAQREVHFFFPNLASSMCTSAHPPRRCGDLLLVPEGNERNQNLVGAVYQLGDEPRNRTMHKILEKKTIAPGIRMLVLEVPLVARNFQPGQFLVIRAFEHSERIPLTALHTDPASGTLTIVVQEVGKSTLELGSLEPGDTLLDVVGPLGTPTPAEKYGTAVCLAGGVGAAEVILDLELLRRAGNYLIAILGARNKELVILEDEIRQRVDELVVCTDDGSYGFHGLVTDPLRQLINEGREVNHVTAVGPLPMMRAVAELTRPHSIPTTVSLNTIMLDGTGMCGSCRLTVGGEVKFCCVHGPAFDAHQVDFEELSRRQRRFLDEERISFERYRRVMGLAAVRQAHGPEHSRRAAASD